MRLRRESANRNGVTGWNDISSVSAAVVASGFGGAAGVTVSGAVGSTLKLQFALPPFEPTATL